MLGGPWGKRQKATRQPSVCAGWSDCLYRQSPQDNALPKCVKLKKAEPAQIASTRPAISVLPMYFEDRTELISAAVRCRAVEIACLVGRVCDQAAERIKPTFSVREGVQYGFGAIRRKLEYRPSLS